MMVLISQILATLLLASGITCSPSLVRRKEVYRVVFPDYPDSNLQVIKSSYQSFSIEFFAFAEYGANTTYENPMNTNLWNHVRELGNVPLKIRIGGSSQGSVYYLPEQEQGLIGYYQGDADKTYNVTLGPTFYDIFDAWPKDTQFVLGLPYSPEKDAYLTNNIEIARRDNDKLGDRLLAIELGNERQDLGLSPPDFTKYFVEDAYVIAEKAFGNKYATKFVAGTLQAPTIIQCADLGDTENCSSTTSLLKNGINDKGIIQWTDTHQYAASLDTGNQLSRQALMIHNHTTFFVDSNRELADYSVAQGIPYILGESNSLFGHGTVNTSDTFAAALWNIDWTLYSAQTNISGIGYHQSFGWHYSAWRPIAAFGYPAGILPSYYAWWIVQKALGSNNGSGKQVEALINDDYLTMYGIYDTEKDALASAIVVNLQDWDSGHGQTSRPEVTVDFDDIRTACGEAKVYRLTAPGADIKNPEKVTFAGQFVDELKGTINGKEETEELRSEETITLKAAEAVLVTFC